MTTVGDHSEPLLERWRNTEPVRLYLYGILVPGVAVLVGYGWLTTERAGLWLAVGAAVLLFTGAGTELARHTVDSPRTVETIVERVRADTAQRVTAAIEARVQDEPEPPTGELGAVDPPTRDMRAVRPPPGG